MQSATSHVHDHERDVGRFDRWSARYDRSLYQPLFFSRVHRRLLDRLSPGEEILDVGCGTGRLAVRLQEATGGLVVGVDPAPGMVAEARRKAAQNLRLRFVVAGAEALPFADASFGAAVSAVSSHHWKDPAKGFAEVARILRPGSPFLLADQGSLGPAGGALRRLRRVDPHHHRGWTPRMLGDLLYHAGFQEVRGRTLRIMGNPVVFVEGLRPATRA